MSLKCPKCQGLVQHGRWVIITELDDKSNVVAWRSRWEPNKELVCSNPEHGSFTYGIFKPLS